MDRSEKVEEASERLVFEGSNIVWHTAIEAQKRFTKGSELQMCISLYPRL